MCAEPSGTHTQPVGVVAHWHTATSSTLSIHCEPWAVLGTGPTEVIRMLPPQEAHGLPGEIGKL